MTVEVMVPRSSARSVEKPLERSEVTMTMEKARPAMASMVL